MPGQSIRLRGWLGRYVYARRGVVQNPYPIGMYGAGWNISHYYSSLGWCYQVRRTWHGMQNVVERAYVPTNPRTETQQAWRARFAQGVAAWQAMDQGVKDYYHNLRYPRYASGYNRFLHYFLTGKPC